MREAALLEASLSKTATEMDSAAEVCSWEIWHGSQCLDGLR
jgi:hypothetical protein